MRVIEHLFIPLEDGTRLAARLFLPDDAAPVPAILEYIPYRKRDGTRTRDQPMHGWFAAHGYAAVRVDQRGSGESDGLLHDEYLPQEQDDALEVIAWIAAQPWCDGAVGMMGKSWGGFNALQVAARRPPALRAIITVCSTDDRYADDIHYMGGCLLTDNLWWGAIMLAYQARPGDPALLGPEWRAAWLARLDAMPCWPALWMAHPRRDAYWRHGSVCEDFAAIQCPVLAVGGWADSYTNAVPRLLAGLDVPRAGIIGPWAHIYPQDGVPAPAIGFLQEATRWWDRWLKGRAVGDWPMLRAYVQDWTPPATTRPNVPGRWVVETAWPSAAITPRTLHLAAVGLADTPGQGRRIIDSPSWTGAQSGAWMGTGIAGEMPGDQRPDDALSVVFDSAPLAEDCDILGNPVVVLALHGTGQIAARLCDVAEDGCSLRVSYGLADLAQVPDGAPVRLVLKACGHRFRRGHRLRLAVSNAYWPIAWPAAQTGPVALDLAGSLLELPVRHPGAPDAAAFPPPALGPAAPVTQLAPGALERRVEQDQISGAVTHVITAEGGLFGEGTLRLDDIGMAVAHGMTRRLTIGGEHFSAHDDIAQHYEMARDDWRIRIETRTALREDAEGFHLSGTLVVKENGAMVRERHWDERFPR